MPAKPSVAAGVERHDLGVLHRKVVAVRLSSRNVFSPDLVVEALSSPTANRDIGPMVADCLADIQWTK